ncbi:MAG TPA: biosynthetic peptidoglycan transglycosylase [Nitrospiria bacterium]
MLKKSDCVGLSPSELKGTLPLLVKRGSSERPLFLGNLKEKRLYRGGSTITQQLAKNRYLEPSKNIFRKIKELAITVRLERKLEKRRILEIYLNVVEWGKGIDGAEAASRHYFGKTAADLTIEEASWLAAILPSPLRFEKKTAIPTTPKSAPNGSRALSKREKRKTRGYGSSGRAKGVTQPSCRNPRSSS